MLEERRDIYSRWTRGHTEGLVATTALAAGNDYPHVRIAAHLGNPFDMVTFVQQSGRAGRDGKTAVSLLIPKGKAMPKIDHGSQDLSGKLVMHKYVNPVEEEIVLPDGCLRQMMSRFLDGQSYTCGDFGDDCEECDICCKGEKWKDL